MTSRERVNRALQHREPDKVPIDFGGVHTSIHVHAYNRLLEYLGMEEKEVKIQEIIQQIVYPSEKILKMFGADVIGIYPRPASTWKLEIDSDTNEWVDEWGTRFVKPKDGYFYDIKEHAMANMPVDELDLFPFPDPSDRGRVSGLRNEVLDLYNKTDKALIFFSPTWGLWESLWLLRGFEQAYIDIQLNRDFVQNFFYKMMRWSQSFWKSALTEIGDLIDVVALSDDLGTQRGPMFNPDIYRSILKPLHKELVSAIKEATSAKVYLHSCGSVSWAIQDFIECGIDILNPVQVGAENMDSAYLKDAFGDNISFWGGGCDTDLILRGSSQEVEDEVRKRMNGFKTGGGYVFASIHNIQANTPPENVYAMYNTAVKIRNY
jgi:uroporphyrinogen decarboxylase